MFGRDGIEIEVAGVENLDRSPPMRGVVRYSEDCVIGVLAAEWPGMGAWRQADECSISRCRCLGWVQRRETEVGSSLKYIFGRLRVSRGMHREVAQSFAPGTRLVNVKVFSANTPPLQVVGINQDGGG